MTRRTIDQEALRDWHRLFGLLLTDFFSGSPFAVDIERDLSEQQRFLDVVIIAPRPWAFRRSVARWNGRAGGTQLDYLQVPPRGAGQLGHERADRP